MKQILVCFVICLLFLNCSSAASRQSQTVEAPIHVILHYKTSNLKGLSDTEAIQVVHSEGDQVLKSISYIQRVKQFDYTPAMVVKIIPQRLEQLRKNENIINIQFIHLSSPFNVRMEK